MFVYKTWTTVIHKGVSETLKSYKAFFLFGFIPIWISENNQSPKYKYKNP